MMQVTKQGKDFQKALEVVRVRIERQLRKHSLLEKGEEFDITIYREDEKRMPLSITVWNAVGSNIKGIYYFYNNGQIKG